MTMATHRTSAVCAALGAAVLASGAGRTAYAQFAVIDVASIAQLVQQVQLLAQQLAAARAQLLQAQTLYQSMTGSRGMQALLGDATLNYLPSDWNTLLLAAQGQGAFTALAGGVSSAVAQNAVLSPAQLSQLSADEQSLITASRQNAALLQSLVAQSLDNASGRFADIERLSTAIGSTPDQKSVLELQATVGAEQGLLLGEQTKLQILNRAIRAQELTTRERQRELAIAGQGSFNSRFEPSLP
jgi:type IV secretion system protein VirB5